MSKDKNKPIAKMGVFVDYAALPECKNVRESYGEICIKCNRCKRFSKKKVR